MHGKYCFLEHLSQEYNHSISTEHQVQHAHLFAAATQHDLVLQQAVYKPALRKLEREIVLSLKQLHQIKEAFAKWYDHDAEIGGPNLPVEVVGLGGGQSDRAAPLRATA